MRATDFHHLALDARMRPIDWLALLVVMCIIGGLAGAGLAGL
ncbi:MAG: hypothetical protein NUV51_12575 [Sulfuricaulis sp.]|nr:hypothetical protein [Sulfuricaulis sp.]